MNERIKKLAEQATSYSWTATGRIEEFDKDKFAELIIKECATWMTQVEDEDGDHINDSFYWAGKMTQYFGVE
jgi:hypothetical protein